MCVCVYIYIYIERERERERKRAEAADNCNEGATTMGRCLNSYSVRILGNFRNYNLEDGTRLERSG